MDLPEIEEYFKPLKTKDDDSLDLDIALREADMIAKRIIASIDYNNPETENLSRLYGYIAESYLLASEKTKEEFKRDVAFSANYWEMLEAKTRPRGSDESRTITSFQFNEKEVKSDLTRIIEHSKRDIRIASGEAGLLERGPEIVNALIESLKRNVKVFLYTFIYHDESIIWS